MSELAPRPHRRRPTSPSPAPDRRPLDGVLRRLPARRVRRRPPRRSRRQPRPARSLGGLITGAILGAVQAWGLGRNRPSAAAWIAATALGLMRRARRRRRRWSTTAPAWPTWSSRAPSAALAVGVAQAVRAAAACSGRVAFAWPVALGAHLGRRLGRSPPRPASRSTSSSPSSAPAAPSSSPPSPPSSRRPRPPRQRERRHEPPRRLRHRPGRPPRRRAARRTAATTSSPSTAAARADIPGADVVGGDATDPAFTTRVAAGADVVYFCLNATNYARWAEEFPPLQRGGPRRRRGRRCPSRRPRQPLRLRPTARAATWSRPCAARPDLDQGRHPRRHDRRAPRRPPGRARSRSRSAGPRTTSDPAPPAPPSARPSSAPPLTGRTAQVMGDPDQPHSYSYTPDVAAGLITLGTQPAAHRRRSGTCRSPRPVPPGRSSTRSTSSPATDPACFAAGAHHPARCSGWSSRRCASTCTPSTSSPTVGRRRHQVPHRLRRPRPHPSTTPWPPPSQWYRDRPPATQAASTTPTGREGDHDEHRSTHPATRRRRAWPLRPLLSPSPASPPSDRSSTTPPILEEPTADILPLYREHQGAVIGWFLVLVVSAALLAPAGVLLGRLAGGSLGPLDRRRRHRRRHRPGHRPVPLGAPRPRHQPTTRPTPSRTADAQHTFELLHTWLGKVARRDHRLRAHRDLHRARRPRRHPRHRAPVDDLPRLRLRRPDRHRRRHPARGRRRQPHQLRRLRRLVPLAHRHGRRPVACPG